MDPALLGAGAEEDARRFDHAVSRFTDELIGLMPEGRECLESYVRAQCCLLVDEKVRLFREAAARRERQLARRQGEKTRAVQKISDLKDQQHAQEVRRLAQQLRAARASRLPAVGAALSAARRAREGAAAHLLFLLWRAAAAAGGRGATCGARAPRGAQDSERAQPGSKATYRWRCRPEAKENDPPGNGAGQEDDHSTSTAAPLCGSALAPSGARVALGVKAAVAQTPTPLLSSFRTLSTDASKDSLQQTSRTFVEVPVKCTAQLSRIPSVPRGVGSAPASGSGTPVADGGAGAPWAYGAVPALPPWAAAPGGGSLQLQRCLSSRSCCWTDRSGLRDTHQSSSARLESCDVGGDSRRASSNSRKSSQGAAQPPPARPEGRGGAPAPPPAPAASPLVEMRCAPAGRGSPTAEWRHGLGGGSLASVPPPPPGAAPAAVRVQQPGAAARQLPSAGSSLTISVGAESPLVPPPQRAPSRAGSPPASGRGLRPACAPPGGVAAQGLVVAAPTAAPFHVALAHPPPSGGGVALQGPPPVAQVAVVHSQMLTPGLAPGHGVLRTPSAARAQTARGAPLQQPVLANVICKA